MDLEVYPKIVKMVPGRVFCPTEKTLISASPFSFHLLLSGTAGPSEIVEIRCKYHQIRDATLFHKRLNFLEVYVKSDPPSDP